MAFQAFNINMMNNGYGYLGSQPISYSHLYFQGLRLLTAAVLQKMSCRRLHEVACNALDIEPFRGQLKKQRHVELATLRLETRIKAMKMVSWLMSDWPNQFAHACGEAYITPTKLFQNLDPKPFWLHSVALSANTAEVYKMQQEEHLSAKLVVERVKGRKVSDYEVPRIVRTILKNFLY
jgi:hypothetical protein